VSTMTERDDGGTTTAHTQEKRSWREKEEKV
jgi:hypothetical protein